MVFKNKCSFQNELNIPLLDDHHKLTLRLKLLEKPVVNLKPYLLSYSVECLIVQILQSIDKESIQLALNDISEYPKHLSFKYDIGANI